MTETAPTPQPTATDIFDYTAMPLDFHPCNLCGSDVVAPMWRGDRYELPVQFGRCLKCSLVQINPRMSVEDYAAFYADGTYRKLVALYSNGQPQNTGDMSHVEAVAGFADDYLQTRRGGTLIDIGGGTGELAAWVSNRYGLTATVLDPSAGELESADRCGFTTIAESVETWHPAQRYDVITCLRSIDHFHDIAGALAKFRAALADDGVLIVDAVSWPYMAERFAIRHTLKVDHVYYLSEYTMRMYLEKAGFRIVRLGRAQRMMVFVCEKEGAPIKDDHNESDTV